jgi:hypothetical protein
MLAQPISLASSRPSSFLKMRFLAFTLALPLLGANQALVCPGPTWGSTATVPSSAPFTSIGSYRVEGRMFLTTFSGTNNYLDLAGDHKIQYTGGILYFVGLEHSTDYFTFSSPSTQLPSDLSFRMMRDLSTGNFTLETWKADGTQYAIQTLTAVTGTTSIAGSEQICGPGGFNGGVTTMDFMRVYNTAIPIGSPPPAPITSPTIPSTVLDYEFTGNLNDSSGNGVTLSPSSSATFTSTIPTYNPLAYASGLQVLRANSSNWSISGAQSFSYVGTGALTYSWTLGTCPNSPTLSGSSTSVLSVIGSTTVFGDCSFNLTVTDESSNSGSAASEVGGVLANSSGVVNVTAEANANVATVLGPQQMYGTNPWPWADQNHKFQADFYAPLLANSTFAGTVPSITHGGSTGATQVTYVVVAVGSSGNVIAISQPGVTTNSSATLTGSNTNIIPTLSLMGSSSCTVYRTVAPSSPSSTGIIGSVTCGSPLVDTGLAGDSSTAPTNPYPDWMTPLSGTISLTNGVATVTGTSTNFQRDFCSGGTSPTGQDVFVVWTTASAAPLGIPQKTPYTISGCSSATSMTLNSSYVGTTASGLSYSIMRNYGAWINGSTNYNYYDAVLAFQSMYYISGLSVYHMAANNLADYWMEMPYLDYFRATGGNVLPGRVKSMTGLTVRYLESNPTGYLSGIQNAAAFWVNTYPTLPTQTMQNCQPRPGGAGVCPSSNSVFPYDSRDYLGYPIWEVALGALFDPTNAAADKVWLNNNIAAELTIQSDLNANWGANKVWPALQSGMCATGFNGYTGTVTLTNGSATVTGSGTNWSSSLCFGTQGGEQMLVSFDDDTTPYCPVYVSAAQFTLRDAATCTTPTNYGGVSRSAAYWMMAVTNTNNGGIDGDSGPGPALPPFMDGILMSGWYFAYLATSNATVAQFVKDSANWLETYGERSSTGGVYYSRISPWCEYNGGPEGRDGCGSDSTSGSRFLSLEDMGGFAFAAVLNPVYIGNLDQLYAHTFGKLGGPNTDGQYATELDSPSLSKWKDFGFGYGIGAGARAPAVPSSSATNSGSVSASKSVSAVSSVH